MATSLGAVIYDLETEQFELLGKEGQATTSVAFSSDGALIAVGQRNTSTTQIFSVDNFDLELELHTYSETATAISFSPDSNLIAIAGDRASPDQMLRGDFNVQVWDISAETEIALLRDIFGAIVDMDFSSERLSVAMQTLGHDPDTGAIYTFDTGSWDQLTSLLSGPMSPSLVVDEDIALFGIIIPRQEATLRLWDLSTDEVIWEIPQSASALAISPRMSMLAYGRAFGEAGLRDLATGAEIATFPKFDGYIKRLDFSSEDRMLAVVIWSNDNRDKVEIWDIDHITPLLELQMSCD
jgi:WD40 repeat protein